MPTAAHASDTSPPSPPRRRTTARVAGLALLGLLLAALAAPAAQAHGTAANYRSELQGLRPQVRGLSLEVVDRDQFLRLTNHTGKTVLLYGYQREPYVRIAADGTVQVNHDSPSYYLNMDRAGTTPVPASASPKAPPRWVTVARDGAYRWHDHREHWMGSGVPLVVKDQSKTWVVQRYSIPMQVGEQQVAASGTLYWLPTKRSIAFQLLVGFIVLVVVVGGARGLWRRRRGGRPAPLPAEPAKEAW
jgi:hypothetical protein